jgi:hypothetical protein
MLVVFIRIISIRVSRVLDPIGLLDPYRTVIIVGMDLDPEVDPDPDTSLNKQKIKKKTLIFTVL